MKLKFIIMSTILLSAVGVTTFAHNSSNYHASNNLTLNRSELPRLPQMAIQTLGGCNIHWDFSKIVYQMAIQTFVYWDSNNDYKYPMNPFYKKDLTNVSSGNDWIADENRFDDVRMFEFTGVTEGSFPNRLLVTLVPVLSTWAVSYEFKACEIWYTVIKHDAPYPSPSDRIWARAYDSDMTPTKIGGTTYQINFDIEQIMPHLEYFNEFQFIFSHLNGDNVVVNPRLDF